MNDQPKPDQVQLPPGHYETETAVYPWYVKELRKMNIGKKLKSLLFVILIGVGLYVLYQFFGWTYLLGFVMIPAWYFWALRQIDKESYTLIEVRLAGDELQQGEVSFDTQTNIYDIPPDIWKEMKKKGNPYTVGHRIYICEKFKETEDGYTVYFSEDPRLSNLTFYASKQLWLDLKHRLPELQEQVAMYSYDTESRAMDETLDILLSIGRLRDFKKYGKRYRLNRGTDKSPIVTYPGKKEEVPVYEH